MGQPELVCLSMDYQERVVEVKEKVQVQEVVEEEEKVMEPIQQGRELHYSSYTRGENSKQIHMIVFLLGTTLFRNKYVLMENNIDYHNRIIQLRNHTAMVEVVEKVEDWERGLEGLYVVPGFHSHKNTG